MSGGEPCLSKYFQHTVNTLSEDSVKQIDIKVLTNGWLFKSWPQLSPLYQKIKKIGFSINTKQDIMDAEKLEYDKLIEKITLITNFGSHNVFDFKNLYEFFIKNKFSAWQVQLTQGKYQLSEEGIGYLISKLNEVAAENIVYSDNLQNTHTCMAGINSCGILADGSVVSCLSKRCWDSNIGTEGNLLHKSLNDIWENGFKNERFSSCKCCRDCIKYPAEKLKDIGAEKFFKELTDLTKLPQPAPYPYPITWPRTYPYPCQPQITLYGVWYEPQVYAYGPIYHII